MEQQSQQSNPVGRPPKAPTVYVVPAGTPPKPCRGATCDAEVYFIKSPNLKNPSGRIPVDCEPPDEFVRPFGLHCHAPSDVDSGRGVSHFLTCPDRRQFSGASRGGKRS